MQHPSAASIMASVNQPLQKLHLAISLCTIVITICNMHVILYIDDCRINAKTARADFVSLTIVMAPQVELRTPENLGKPNKPNKSPDSKKEK